MPARCRSSGDYASRLALAALEWNASGRRGEGEVGRRRRNSDTRCAKPPASCWGKDWPGPAGPHGHRSDAAAHEASQARHGRSGTAEISEPYPRACRTLGAAQRKAELVYSKDVEGAWT